MILGGNGTVQGGAGWYLVVLGQYKAVLVGIWWYWVSINWYCLCEVLLGWEKACMPVYIEKINGDANQPTDRPRGRIWSNLPFRNLDNRKKAEICNSNLI